MSCRKRMKKHFVKKAQNLAGRLKALWAMALQGMGSLREHGLFKSTVFASAGLVE